MKQLKMPYAITSLSFNDDSSLLAVSSYSDKKIDIYSISKYEKLKSIELTDSYNPENSILWIDNTIICIDDNAKKISFIDYESGKIINEFNHLHVRGFQSLDSVEFENQTYILATGKKIHPPTIEKLGLDIDYKELSNLFLLDTKGNLIESISIAGNIINAKFINGNAEKLIYIIYRNIEGTFASLFSIYFDQFKVNQLSSNGAMNAFIANTNKYLSIVLQFKKTNYPSMYVKYDSNNLAKVDNEYYETSRYVSNSEGYINSIFGSGSLTLTETLIKNDISELKISNDELEIIKFKSYGFMESVAFGKNIIAWSENNYINLVNI